jgi:exopolyphosphatase/guanosine-5'-triphosphate,3'-diphosphate pyrophosphatase
MKTESASPIAVIDVGSNSIKLLVAACEQQVLHPLYSHTITSRISKGISDPRHLLSEESMQRGVHAICELVNSARQHGCKQIAIVATSAVRDAMNKADFQQLVHQQSGEELQILSGEEEARAIGRGILLDADIRRQNGAQIIDLGGGSMEYLLFERGEPRQIHSYQLGSVRLTELAQSAGIGLHDTRIMDWVRGSIHTALEGPPRCLLLDTHAPLYGAGGSLFTIYHLATETGRLSGISLTRELLQQLYREVLPLSLEQRAALPGVTAGRADILPIAIATLDVVCEIAEQPSISLCPYNLRYGIAAQILNATDAVVSITQYGH